MDRPSRSSTARRGSARALHLSLAVGVAAVGLVAVPATASASPAGTVTPVLDCYVDNRDGSWTAVFGYRNTTATPVTIPVGPDNKVTPTTYGTPQPTTFQPGLHHGVFSVTVTRGAGPMWHLDQDNLAARRKSASACPSSTELPSEGNGTGPAIALAVAGAVGAVALHRARRRTRTATGLPSPVERDDA
jgi:hypothetical protein